MVSDHNGKPLSDSFFLHLMILHSILEFGYESFLVQLCLVIFLLITFLALTASNDRVSVNVLGHETTSGLYIKPL